MSRKKVGVVVFPGSNCDHDCFHAAEQVMGWETQWLWHKDRDIPSDMACVILPGGFTYGDYLRAGAIAHLSPIMGAVKAFADRGGFVIGICNGFQILTESGLLPGALMKNRGMRFLCKTVPLKVENCVGPWTDFERPVLRVPIAHGQGNYYIPEDGLKRLQDQEQVVFRYADLAGNTDDGANPNGSVWNIAGIRNQAGNVLGMMPHPERCSEEELGNADGRLILESLACAL